MTDKQTVIKTAAPIIKFFEQCRLRSYLCPAQVWTIGWGHTRGVHRGMVWTQQKADETLDDDLGDFLSQLLQISPMLKDEPDHRVAACLSFIFNLGATNFRKSTLRKKLEARDYTGTAAEFLKWNRAGGKILTGLYLRRNCECAMFNGTDWRVTYEILTGKKI